MTIDLDPLFVTIGDYVDTAFATEHGALIAQVATLEQEKAALVTEVATLRGLITGKDALIAQQIAEIAQKNAEIAAKNAQIAALQADLAECEAGNPPVLPTISVGDATATEGGPSASFIVSLSGPHTAAITVNYATANGTAAAGQDYTAASGTLTFAPGETSKTVAVAIINDTIVETPEAFTLNLTNAVPAGVVISDASGQATITSEDVTAPPPTGSIPLTYNDARFSGNAASSNVTISGGTLANKTITATGSTASIVVNALAIIQTCRVNSRECVRVTAGVDIRNCYLEATGQGADHADTIQTYSPGQTNGVLKVTDSSIVAHNTAATAGLFVADAWGGTVTLLNVMFQGGPYGCRIHADGGKTVNVSLENVFFVGPFMWGPLLINNANGSGTLNITKWVNVRNATIVNGALVPGSLIPSP